MEFACHSICVRANTRLHYLKRLNRAGLPVDRLAHWHITVTDQCLNTVRSFGTKVCRSIRPSRLRQSRDELCASFIPSQHLCPIGRHSTIPDFSLFPTDVTNPVEISLRKCMSHSVAFTICCHQLVTPISPPGSGEHPYIRDLAIESTVTNHLSTMLS